MGVFDCVFRKIDYIDFEDAIKWCSSENGIGNIEERYETYNIHNGSLYGCPDRHIREEVFGLPHKEACSSVSCGKCWRACVNYYTDNVPNRNFWRLEDDLCWR